MRLKRQLLNTSALSAMIAFAFMAGVPAHANPVDGVVSAGSADITASGKTLDITQHSDKAIIDWRGFDIAPDETTNFYQPSSSSITVNRVHSSQASQIEGHLNANGNVVIINQNGIVFGAGAQVDVHGLVASTSDVDNDRFMNDAKARFDLPGNTSATITNNGTITAHDAGLVGFVAPNVENNGTITANLGRVHLASGDKATVDFYGDGLLEVEASDQLQHQIVKNTGTITADGGKIAMTAATGGQVVSSLINASGVIHAQSVGVHNGEITIGGGKHVIVAGTIDASSTTGKGGKITVTAQNIKLTNTARIDASGQTGGGTIKIGGDAHGAGPTPNAKTLTVDQGAYIKNDALLNGNGGETILWSDNLTSFEGLLSAKGGAEGGDGGFAEVSGKDVLDYDGFADLSANDGYEFGTLLLDPSDITISSAADSGGSFTSSTYTGSAGTSFISVTTLQTQLGGGANVLITTTSGQSGNGDITLANNISWSSARTLTLTATRDIILGGTVTASSSGGLTLNSGRDITVNSAISTATGAVTMTSTRDVFLNANITSGSGVNITATAGRDLTIGASATISSGSSGTLVLKAAGGVATNTGVFTNSGVMNVGTGGTFTLLSGLDSLGARADLTLSTSNTTLQGANVGVLSITGFRDINVNRNITSSSSITINAERHLTVGNVTLTTGAAGGINLKAATTGGITTTGALTNGGTISTGTGTMILQSGLDSLGARTDLTLATSNVTLQGANVSGVNINGFRDINVNRSLTSAAGITTNAERNLTIASGVTLTTGAAGGVSLRAATTGGVNSLGLFTNSGNVSVGTGVLTLSSGVDGSGNRVDLTFNTAGFTLQGATVGAVSITGFNDVNISRTLPTSSTMTVTAARDLNLTGAVSSTSSSTFGLTAGRDIVVGANMTGLSNNSLIMQAARNFTINSGVTVSSGGLSLKAAGGVIGNQGVFTNNGVLNLGSVSLTLLSGLDSMSARTQDLTLNSTNLTYVGATIGGLNVTGFRDVTFASDIPVTGAGSVVVTAERDLTINSGVTVASGATGNVTLKAAGGLITNTGVINQNGTISSGTGSMTLLNGLNSGGTRNDLTIDTHLVSQGATMGGLNITGYRDVTFANSFAFASATSVTAERNLSVNSGVTLTSAPANSLTLKSAGGVITNTGQLLLSGTINQGSSILTLSSGLDGSGNRNDLVLNSSNLTLQGASFSTLNLTGYRDITLNRALPITGVVTITAERNLSVNSALSGSSLLLKAAGGVTTNIGALSINAALTHGTGTFTLLSGTDSSGGVTNDLSISNGNFIMSGASVGVTSITGFRDINFNGNLASSSSITLNAGRDVLYTGLWSTSGADNLSITAGRDVTLGSFQGGAGSGTLNSNAARNITLGTGTTISGGTTGSIVLRAAGNVITNTGVINLNNALITGNATGTLTLTNGLDSFGNRADLNLSSTNLTYSTTLGNLLVSGYRDITMARDLNMTSVMTVTAERNLTVNSGVTLTSGASNALTLKSAGGVTTNTGLLAINGTINMGTGTLTLTSGLDSFGVNADLSLASSMLTKQSTNLGSVIVSGYRDITLNSGFSSSIMTLTATRDILLNAAFAGALNFTAGRDLTFAANVTSTGTGSSVTGLATRNLTINSGATVSTGTTGIMSLKAAGGVTTNQGALVLNGTIGVGSSSTFTLLSGVDSFGVASQDLVLDNGSMSILNGVISTTSITGFRDITINRAISGIGAITLNAARDIAMNSTVTSTTTSNLTYTAGRDMVIAANQSLTAATSTPDLVFNAGRNLTVNSGVTLRSGLGGSITLKAAGGVITNTGLLTMNGVMNIGSATLSLVNGLDPATGLRQNDFVLSNSNLTNQAATQGTLSILGFRDLTVARNLNMGSTTLTAERNLTLNPGVVMTANPTTAITLRAAGNVITNVGQLFLNNAVISLGTGALNMTTGTDSSGNRQDFTLDNSFLTQQAGTIGGLTLIGFRDITIPRNVSLGAGTFAITAERDLTISSGVTLTAASAGAATFRAGSATGVNIGTLTNNGIISMGTGLLTLSTGLNSSGTRTKDLTIDTSWLSFQGAPGSLGGISTIGFRDVTIDSNLTLTGAASVIMADRNLTLASGRTLTYGGTNAGLTLRAGGATSVNQGALNINGILAVATPGTLVLAAGQDSLGTYSQDFVLDTTKLSVLGADAGRVTITGFRDLTFASSFNFGSILSATAERNLTINSGVVLVNGPVSSMTLRAGGATSINQGEVSLLGKITFGTSGTLTITNGLNSSGMRTKDLVLDSAHFAMQSATMGALTVNGFQDISLLTDLNLVANSTLNVVAQRNLTLGSGVNVTTAGTGGTILSASAGGNGLLNLNGKLNLLGSGAVTLSSGADTSGVRNDMTLNSSNYVQGATIGSLSLVGFKDTIIDTDITSSGNITVTAEHNLTINSGRTITSGAASAVALRGGGSTGVATGGLYNNGVVNVGRGLTFGTGTDAVANANDFIWDNTRWHTQSADVGALTVAGFRDAIFNTDITLGGNSSVQAYRDVIIPVTKTMAVLGNNQLNLYAANALYGRGELVIDGSVSMLGTGGLFLSSAQDSSGNYKELVWDGGSSIHIARSGATTNGFYAAGFRDIIVTQDINSTSYLYLKATRDVIVNSGVTVSSAGSTTTKLTAGNTNAGPTGIGAVHVNGLLSYGIGTLEIQNGAGSTVPNDLVLDSTHFVANGASVGNVTIAGFRDVTIGENINSTGDISVTAQRNLTLNSGVTISAATANKNLFLYAANGDVNGEGVLALNGNIVSRASALELMSGHAADGTRPDFIFDNTKVTTATIYGGTRFKGFRDITFASDLSVNSYLDVLAMRNLTVNNGVSINTSPSNSIILYAAGGNWQNEGILTNNGIITRNSIRGTTIVSGYDPVTGERPDMVFGSSSYTISNPNMTLFVLEGFRDVTMAQSVSVAELVGTPTSGTFSIIATRNVTINPGVALATIGTGTSQIVAENFINNSGANAITKTGGRSLIYSTDPTMSVMGNLAYDFRVFNCSYGTTCGSLPGTGSGFVFRNDGTLEIIAGIRNNAATSLPATVVRAPQTAGENYATSMASAPAASSYETPVSFVYNAPVISGIPNAPDYMLTFAPELAVQFDLKNWEF